MAAPLILIGAGAIARAVAAASAKEAAKRGVKKLTAAQTRKIVRTEAAKRGVKKISPIQARRIAEQSAGTKARRLGGESGLRVTKPKPDVRITTKAGKYRGYGTLSKERTTVTKPVKRETNKKGSAITVRKTQPRKPVEVRAQHAKERRDRFR